jgi:type II secretory pathway pseudopilin PulG
MKRRQGFTLVELLVSMALIIFIMAILSGAFQAAMTTFRNLKGQGDMAEKLRAVTQLLQRDLAADHFEGRKRLSNPNFWLNGPPQQGFFRIWQGSTPIGIGTTVEGADVDGINSYLSTNHMLAFTIKLHGNQIGDFLSAGGTGGAFLGNLNSPNSPFGPNEARYLPAAGATTYNYQWGEVAWFLEPQTNPTTQTQDQTITDPTTGSAPNNLYTLYRRQCLLVPDNSLVTPSQSTANASQYLEVSNWPNTTSGNLYFNSPIDITVPWRRFGMVQQNTYPAGLLYGTTQFPASQWPLAPTQPNTQPPPANGTWLPPSTTPPPTYAPAPPVIPAYPTMVLQGATGTTFAGADIQLNDVISFDVRVLPLLPSGTAASSPDPFVTLFQAPFTTLFANGNPAFYNTTTNLTGPAVFDTWSSVNDTLSNYSQWNVPVTTATTPTACIPMWNSGPLTYTYPVGNALGQSVTVTGSGPIIMAIQISIRIWDFKTNQSRQVTIVQAM